MHRSSLAGGYEELWAEAQGLPPPVNLYRPRVGNVAPRTDSWAPARGNTQTAPRSGPHKNLKPAQQQPRAPLCPEIKKLLP